MTLTEAAASIGARVAYLSPHARETRCCAPEEGVITNTGKRVAFVLYGDAGTPRATNPGDLTLIAGDS